jgi:phage I-like protein
MLTLLLAALLSQTMYEWTDAQGGAHFTDDRSTIPSNAKKVRTTTGQDVTVLKMSDSPKPAPVDAQPVATKNTCDELKKKIVSLEAQRDAMFRAYDARVSEAQAQCRATLVTHGQGAFAQCVASTNSRTGPTPDDATINKAINDTKDALRRAQVGGCG